MDLRSRHLIPAPEPLAEALRNLPKDPAFETLPPLGSSKR